MSLITEGEAKMTKAKTHLIIKHPFIAIVALTLRFRNAGEFGITLPFPTMATDGKHVFWDEVFVATLTIYELIGVVAHEVLHVIFMHMLRRGNRDWQRWNMAADYVVNIIVLDMGLQLPADRLFDAKYKGKEWTVERVYDDLEQQDKAKQYQTPPQTAPGKPQDGDGQPGQPQPGQNGQPSQQGKQPGKGGKPGKNEWGVFVEPVNEDGTEMSQADKEILGEEIKVKVRQAAEAAKAAGNLPEAFKGLIKALGKPVVNWQDYIMNWVSGHTPDDYTWRKPNRKMLGLYNMITPSVQMNGAGVGVLSIDQSGSVSNDELRKYAVEIVGMIEACNPDKLYIVLHDTKVHHMYVYERGDTFDSLKVAARGGTRIAPVFKYVAEKIDEEVQWMVCFTDMEIMDFPPASEAPDFPVLWAATGSGQGHKFGTYIAIKPALEMVDA